MDALLPKISRPAPRAARRRTGWILGALALTASLVLAPSPPSSVARTARAADSFIDSIGVNTHTFFNDTAYYSRFDMVKRRLMELGVRHVREDLVPERPDQYQRLNQLAAMGIKSTLILGDPDNGASGLEELISILKTKLEGAIDAVEGPNEFDMRGGPGWISRLDDYQQRLYGAIKADSALASLPVIAPSIVHRKNQEALGDISSRLDYGNIHSYPDGYFPESNLSSHLNRAAANSGSKPVMATETGYHTAANWTGEHNPASEQAMAIYMPRMFLEYFRRGVARTYSYELLDEWPDPDRSESESNFGLLRNDLSEKPAFIALRNTIDILEDPGPAFTPGTLNYSLGGNRRDLRHVLLQRRDGTFYLALWRVTSIWDPASRTALGASGGIVKLDFQRPVKGAEKYLPNASGEPVASLPGRDRPIAVNVGARVVIVKVAVGRRGRGRIRLWLAKRSVPAGGRIAVRGRLPRQAAGHSLRVKIQRWQRGWRTVGRSRTSRFGTFRKTIRVPARSKTRASHLRVVARKTKPSRAIRIRIRRSRDRKSKRPGHPESARIYALEPKRRSRASS